MMPSSVGTPSSSSSRSDENIGFVPESYEQQSSLSFDVIFEQTNTARILKVYSSAFAAIFCLASSIIAFQTNLYASNDFPYVSPYTSDQMDVEKINSLVGCCFAILVPLFSGLSLKFYQEKEKIQTIGFAKIETSTICSIWQVSPASSYSYEKR